MNAQTGKNAGLKVLAIGSDRFDSVPISPRMRNRYAPVHVGQEIDGVRLTAMPQDPEAEVVVNGARVSGGQASGVIPLNPGRNILTVAVTAADGQTKNTFHPVVFRDYPIPAWKKVADTCSWIPRDSAGEVVFDGQMWLFGGYIPTHAKDVWCSGDGTNWTCAGEVAASTTGIDIPLTFVFHDRMWVTDDQGLLFSSANGADWTLVTDRAPWRGRGAAGGVVFAGRMWVMGGGANGQFLNDVWSSDNGVDWTQELAHAPWSARTLHNTPLVMDGKMWLIGGAAYGDYYPFRTYCDVWCSSDGRDWHMVTDDAPWPGRIWGSTVVYRDRLWLLGGFRSEPTWENLGDIWYSSDGAHWNQLACPATCRHGGNHNVPVVVNNSVWAPRHEMSVYALNGKLWVVGGMVWPLVNDVWCLDIPGLAFVTQPVVEEFVGTRYEYRARADFNTSRGKIRYRMVDSPNWLSVDAETGRIEGTAPAAGDVRVTVEAHDAAGETARQSYTLHLLPFNK